MVVSTHPLMVSTLGQSS
ncbi:hypothetical protein Taro_056975 [Colocasia esculenta]|uniref:Uncharacterized protein n=1 Tax=Colocasia esculenta TaxID=4460 RepID=A0A843XZ15_COLES|nr:hypothetical protein [Colocasia esculenta]